MKLNISCYYNYHGFYNLNCCMLYFVYSKPICYIPPPQTTPFYYGPTVCQEWMPSVLTTLRKVQAIKGGRTYRCARPIKDLCVRQV